MSDTERSSETTSRPVSRARLAAVLLMTIVVAVGPSWYQARRAIDDTRAQIDDARLRLAQFAARQADRVVAEAFHEVAAAADACASTSSAGVETCTTPAPAFNLAIVAIGPDGSLVSADPERIRAWIETGTGAAALKDLAVADRQAVSEPFAVSVTGHVMVGLGVPVYDGRGSRVATVVGLFDLTDPVVDDLVIPALRMGRTGHADLVDDRGLVLASTNPNHVLEPGDHPTFYAEVTSRRAPAVEEVDHDAEPDDVDQSGSHVMAYAPLRHAPWGMAIGASTAETYDTVASLRRQLTLSALAGIAALTAGITIAVSWTRRNG